MEIFYNLTSVKIKLQSDRDSNAAHMPRNVILRHFHGPVAAGRALPIFCEMIMTTPNPTLNIFIKEETSSSLKFI